jgi:hypothetical protein
LPVPCLWKNDFQYNLIMSSHGCLLALYSYRPSLKINISGLGN